MYLKSQMLDHSFAAFVKYYLSANIHEDSTYVCMCKAILIKQYNKIN